MFGECHGHIFMDGIDYKRAAAVYQSGIDRADVRRKLKTYQKLGVTFYRDGGDHYGASEYARSIAPEYGITSRTPSMRSTKTDIMERLSVGDLIR